MKVFFSGHSRLEDVDSSDAVEMSLGEVYDILWNLDFTGGFVGVCVNNTTVFQVLNQEDDFYSEVLDTLTQDTLSTNLSTETVEQFLEALFSGTTIDDTTARLDINWSRGNLRNP